LSAICWQTLAVSVRTSNTTRSMLRRIARSPRGAPRRQARQCGQGDTGNVVDKDIEALAFLAVVALMVALAVC
jgi:hypothetical protein